MCIQLYYLANSINGINIFARNDSNFLSTAYNEENKNLSIREQSYLKKHASVTIYIEAEIVMFDVKTPLCGACLLMVLRICTEYCILNIIGLACWTITGPAC